MCWFLWGESLLPKALTPLPVLCRVLCLGVPFLHPPLNSYASILQGLFRHHPWKAFLLSWGSQSPPGHASVMAGRTVGLPTVLVLLRAGATSDSVCPQ